MKLVNFVGLTDSSAGYEPVAMPQPKP